MTQTGDPVIDRSLKGRVYPDYLAALRYRNANNLPLLSKPMLIADIAWIIGEIAEKKAADARLLARHYQEEDKRDQAFLSRPPALLSEER